MALVTDINRQLCDRGAARARQKNDNDIVGRIVQLELTEWDGYDLAKSTCRVVYGKDQITRSGSVPEVVDDEITGFIVKGKPKLSRPSIALVNLTVAGCAPISNYRSTDGAGVCLPLSSAYPHQNWQVAFLP
ncbi:MAG: hypothetical protein JWP25_1187 [Bradyrhizobium sp.]|nr:hypothetical protein [Bradyrhizobium sp.]